MTEALFVDAYNPTAPEIRAWASLPDAYFPVQDWDIIVASEPTHDGLVLALAQDRLSPNRRVFLHILYLIAGDAVRTNWNTRSRDQLENVLRQASRSTDEEVRLWAERTSALCANPASFDYEKWCGGGYLRDSHGA
jgi:hypothetical protein